MEEVVRNSQTTLEYNEEVSSIQELEKLYKQGSILVWRTVETISQVSLISALVVIMMMYTTQGVSNTFVDEFFKYLFPSLLLKQNSLPNSFYHAKYNVRKMGLHYNVIHCCLFGHVLFKSLFQDLDSCSHLDCRLSRWMSGLGIVLAKVIWHF